MRYPILIAELEADPLGRGYAAMTDADAATALNSPDRSTTRESMTGDEIFAATDAAEFGAIDAHRQGLWLSFCARESIDPAGAANVAFVVWVFGAGSTTVANLSAQRSVSISRAQELGIEPVTDHNVAEARAIMGV